MMVCMPRRDDVIAFGAISEGDAIQKAEVLQQLHSAVSGSAPNPGSFFLYRVPQIFARKLLFRGPPDNELFGHGAARARGAHPRCLEGPEHLLQCHIFAHVRGSIAMQKNYDALNPDALDTTSHFVVFSMHHLITPLYHLLDEGSENAHLVSGRHAVDEQGKCRARYMAQTQTAPGDAKAAMAPTIINVRGAAVRLGSRTIWNGVDLTVAAGEFIAILGPNGAGKSTLLKAILGLLPLSAGNITVLEQPTRRGNPAIGYVPQRRSFDAEVRVRGRDIVRLGLDGDRWGLPLPFIRSEAARAAAERVARVIDMVDATAYADRPIGELSGGEQQRLLIAQALVTEPRILALDEPLDSLDLANQSAVAGVIRTIARATGAAVLLVAHDINPILPALDRVVYVARGQVTVGTPKEVITTATLSRLYGTPVEVLHASDGRIVVVGQPEGEEVSYHGHR
jgi:zinc/manganese transport system ATP-binding protein